MHGNPKYFKYKWCESCDIFANTHSNIHKSCAINTVFKCNQLYTCIHIVIQRHISNVITPQDVLYHNIVNECILQFFTVECTTIRYNCESIIYHNTFLRCISYFITFCSTNSFICLYRLQYFSFHKLQAPGRYFIIQQDHVDCNPIQTWADASTRSSKNPQDTQR